MITEALIKMSCGIVRGFLEVMPSMTFDTTVFASTGNALAKMGALNGYFPVLTLAACIALVFAVNLYMHAFRVVMFVYHQFWGSS